MFYFFFVNSDPKIFSNSVHLYAKRTCNPKFLSHFQHKSFLHYWTFWCRISNFDSLIFQNEDRAIWINLCFKRGQNDFKLIQLIKILANATCSKSLWYVIRWFVFTLDHRQSNQSLFAIFQLLQIISCLRAQKFIKPGTKQKVFNRSRE